MLAAHLDLIAYVQATYAGYEKTRTGEGEPCGSERRLPQREDAETGDTLLNDVPAVKWPPEEQPTAPTR